MIDKWRGGQELSSGGLWIEVLDECKVGTFMFRVRSPVCWGTGGARGVSQHDCKTILMKYFADQSVRWSFKLLLDTFSHLNEIACAQHFKHKG
jgi:hypothetical protein